MIQGYRMSLFKSKCSKSKLLNTTKIAEHSKVFYLKFTDSSRQEHDAVTVSFWTDLTWLLSSSLCPVN